ncbi:hypothetical protein LEQ41_05730 [Streptococcus agalactiae]|nr:hypothetical protein HMPREF1884_01805 [Streptococcus agalactiae]MCA5916583.1 hypothetical protein [Streptococcus agalactiae]
MKTNKTANIGKIERFLMYYPSLFCSVMDKSIISFRKKVVKYFCNICNQIEIFTEIFSRKITSNDTSFEVIVITVSLNNMASK